MTEVVDPTEETEDMKKKATRDRQTLEEIIEQMVNLGEKDPLEIARKVFDRFGALWVGAELLQLGEDLVADLARRKLGAVRRSAELAIRPGDEIAEGNMRLAKIWIPNEGWKVVADLTSPDLRKRAQWYRSFANAAHRREAWCLNVADMMDSEGVRTLGKLKAPLPSLPEDDDLPELMGAA